MRGRLALVNLSIVSLMHADSLHRVLKVDLSDAGSITHIRLELRITDLCVVAQVLEQELTLRVPASLIIQILVIDSQLALRLLGVGTEGCLSLVLCIHHHVLIYELVAVPVGHLSRCLPSLRSTLS